jgi:riboflavin kinase
MDKTLLLLELAKLGAIGEKKPITVRELARKLGVSPQTALRSIDSLVEEGLLRREVLGRRTYVELTEKAMEYLENLYSELGKALYNGVIVGEVISGLGEGAYYIEQYRERIREYLGFDPYPGTLNLRVIFPRTIFDALCTVRPILIPGFVKEGRSFGDVKAYPVRINGINGAVVVPSRTVHPPKIAEIIAPVNLRKTLGLKDGDRLKLYVTEGGEE